MFWELKEEPNPVDAAVQVVSNKHEVKQANEKLRVAQDRANKAILLCEALWTLMRDKLGVTEEELRVRCREVDMSDGVCDQRVRRAPIECPECRRETTQRFLHCMYCGANIPASPFAS